jgi:acyl-CoA thioester hydrolase
MSRVLPVRGDFSHFHRITTRWADNDAYGHLNNVVYYAFFDTTVNAWLIAQGLLEVAKSEAIGLVVDTGCQYFSPLSFPQVIDVGLRVERIGNSSVRYALGVFAADVESAAAAGHFVHVYVDRIGRQPVTVPVAVRKALATLTHDRTP